MANILSNISEWFCAEHPNDTLGHEIKTDITFLDMLVCLKNGSDIYKFLGVYDSFIREVSFHKLSQISGIDIDTIYKLWYKEKTFDLSVN